MESPNEPKDDRSGPLFGVDVAALVIAWIAVTLRNYVRIRIVKAFGLDDWLMLVAMCTFTMYCSFSLSGLKYGTGKKKADLEPENNATALKWWWCCYLAYSVTMAVAKMSIGVFLLRVTVKRLHKWIIQAAMIVTVVTCLTFFFVSTFQCHPVSYFWDKHTQTGKCIPNDVIVILSYVFSVASVVTDFTFALLPAWIISHLNMQRQTKAALMTLMAMGCIASSAVIVRLPFMRSIVSDNFLYDTVDIAIWSTIEQCLTITAASLATLRPLVRELGYVFGLTSRATLTYGGEGGASGYGKMGTARDSHLNHLNSMHKKDGSRGGGTPGDIMLLQQQIGGSGLKSPTGQPITFESIMEGNISQDALSGDHETEPSETRSVHKKTPRDAV